jgi:mono/diheme cytochrome c family protein
VQPTVLAAITGLGKTVLLLVAGVFIAWAIVTAIFIPRRNRAFPRDLNVYITVTVVLFVAQMSAVWWVTGTQEVEEAEAAEVETGGGETATGDTATESEGEATETEATETETEATETEATETEATETEGTETEQTETTGGGAAGDAAAGKQVFASAGCGGCHTLADAGSNGNVGPNLDDAQPPESLVVDRVTNGKGVMPPFKGQLSDQQIADVAAYVSSVAGS